MSGFLDSAQIFCDLSRYLGISNMELLKNNTSSTTANVGVEVAGPDRRIGSSRDSRSDSKLLSINLFEGEFLKICVEL